mmetsp:Transcript_24595/g.43661  ORF Transcript_24595/g.43661 Transcript_24595/m.43661 type:complete len:219 (+) Transcript_24595:1056-1712(+)
MLRQSHCPSCYYHFRHQCRFHLPFPRQFCRSFRTRFRLQFLIFRGHLAPCCLASRLWTHRKRCRMTINQIQSQIRMIPFPLCSCENGVSSSIPKHHPDHHSCPFLCCLPHHHQHHTENRFYQVVPTCLHHRVRFRCYLLFCRCPFRCCFRCLFCRCPFQCRFRPFSHYHCQCPTPAFRLISLPNPTKRMIWTKRIWTHPTWIRPPTQRDLCLFPSRNC